MLAVYAVISALFGERGWVEIQRLREILENKQHLERSLDKLLVIQSDDVQSLETDSQRIIEEA